MEKQKGVKKSNLKVKLSLGKYSVSSLEKNQLKGAGTHICTGLQETCGGCELPTRNPCVKPSRGWCPQQ